MSLNANSDYHNDRRWEKNRDLERKTEVSKAVLIKSIPDAIDEDYLFRWFDKKGIKIRDVRLMEGRGSRSAAFAFVEFYTVEEAAEWMNEQKGVMAVTEDHTSDVVYSRRSYREYERRRSRDRSRSRSRSRERSQSSDSSGDRHSDRSRDRDRDYRRYDRERDRYRDRPMRDYNYVDWKCPNPICQFVNFAKRRECYRCCESRPNNPVAASLNGSYNGRGGNVDDGSSQIGMNACNTVVLRGLDALTDETRLLESLANITSLEPKNCYVMRDMSTGTSLGYGFMEFDSVANAQKIKDHFTKQQQFEVDGKVIAINFAKNTYSTILASIQYQQQAMCPRPTQYEQQALAAKAASQVMAAHSVINQQPPYPEPDVSKYQWDASSGYYYDHSTGFYYDANTHYYYNSTTQQYLYWDGATHNYVPVSQNSQNTASATAATATDQSVAQEKQQEKPAGEKPAREQKNKKAKDIAKEMEKWAKMQNKKSKSSVVQQQQVMPAPTDADENSADSGTSTSADTAYELLLGSGRLPVANPHQREDTLMPPPGLMGLSKTSKQAAQPVSSKNDVNGLSQMDFIDVQQLTCRLCERKFNSTAILEKHIQKSDLHKQNLMKWKQSAYS